MTSSWIRARGGSLPLPGPDCNPATACRASLGRANVAAPYESDSRGVCMLSRGVGGVLGMVLCLALWPAAAWAGNWENSTYTGEPGEANHVTVQFDGSSVTVTDTAGV